MRLCHQKDKYYKKGLGPEPSWAEHKDQAPHPVARSWGYELKIQNLSKLKSQPWSEFIPLHPRTGQVYCLHLACPPAIPRDYSTRV